jgi:hypothetical protein
MSRIVSTTAQPHVGISPGDVEPMVGISPGDVVCAVPSGAGDGIPHVGISPAIADPERTHVKAIAIKTRFIGLLLLFLRSGTMQELLHLSD